MKKDPVGYPSTSFQKVNDSKRLYAVVGVGMAEFVQNAFCGVAEFGGEVLVVLLPSSVCVIYSAGVPMTA